MQGVARASRSGDVILLGTQGSSLLLVFVYHTRAKYARKSDMLYRHVVAWPSALSGLYHRGVHNSY